MGVLPHSCSEWLKFIRRWPKLLPRWPKFLPTWPKRGKTYICTSGGIMSKAFA